MSYRVTKQYARGSEINCETFKALSEARFYVEKHVVADAAMKVKVIYRIYEFQDLHSEYDSSESDFSGEQSQGSQGKSSGASFHPTPLASAPRPPGMPQNWREEDEEKKK